MMHSRKQEKVRARLKELEGMDRKALSQAWEDCYDTPPPPKTSRPLMIKAIAYKLQEKAFGGLSANAAKALGQIASTGTASKGPTLGQTTKVKPGTRFIREWNGQLIEVLVDEGGRFIWNQSAYPSLSAIAREITGTRRNGPAFFGLRA
jgi:hypothetical protein